MREPEGKGGKFIRGKNCWISGCDLGTL